MSSGAMDSLLEKLRAAAPQARDQRDRRRRARLKERHQHRVASGGQVPDLSINGEASAETNPDGQDDSAEPADGKSVGQDVSEGEDIADRAASMLQGLREAADADGNRTRRRESAEEARRNRRMRRRLASNTSKDSSTDDGLLSPDLERDGMESPMSPLTESEEPPPAPRPLPETPVITISDDE
jgi:cytokinesis protein